MNYKPSADYGAIGDFHTVALVGMDGSVDFMCLPPFDSPTILPALLDHARGGRFKIAPIMDDAQHKQFDMAASVILLTRSLARERKLRTL